MLRNGVKIEPKPETGIQKATGSAGQEDGRQKGYQFRNYLHAKFFFNHEKTSLKGEEVLREMRNLRGLLANLASKRDYGDCVEAGRLASDSLHTLRYDSTWLAEEQVKVLIGWIVLRARHDMLQDRNVEAISHAPTLDCGSGYISISRREGNRERPSEIDGCYDALTSGFNNANVWFHAVQRDPRAIKLFPKELKPALERLGNLPMPAYFRKEPAISNFISTALTLLEKAQDEQYDNETRVAAMDALCYGALAAFETAQNYRIWEDIVRKDFTRVLPKQEMSLSELIRAFKEAERHLTANEFDKEDAAFMAIYGAAEPHIKQEIKEFIRLSRYFHSSNPVSIPGA